MSRRDLPTQLASGVGSWGPFKEGPAVSGQDTLRLVSMYIVNLERWLYASGALESTATAPANQKSAYARTAWLFAYIDDRNDHKLIAAWTLGLHAQPALTHLLADQEIALGKLVEAPVAYVEHLKLLLHSSRGFYAAINALPTVNANFRGRTKEIVDYVTALDREDPQNCAIRGLGGQGKSELAKKIINEPRILLRYGFRIFWIECEQITSVEALRGRIAVAFAWDEAEKCQAADRFTAGLQRERDCGPALLALDNFETMLKRQKSNSEDLPVNELVQELSNLPKLALLVTARDTNWPVPRWQWASIEVLPGLDMKSAQELFLLTSTKADLNRKGEQESLSALLANVYCHPLAIILLACQLESGTIIELLHKYEQTCIALSKEHRDLDREGLDRTQSIEASLLLSYRDTRLSDKCRRLLRMLAELPRPLWKDQATALTNDAGSIRGVEMLNKLALVSFGSVWTFEGTRRGTIDMHPLVREFARSAMLGRLSPDCWLSAWPAFIDRPWLDVKGPLAIFDHNAMAVTMLLIKSSGQHDSALRVCISRQQMHLIEYAANVTPHDARAAAAAARDGIAGTLLLEPVEAADLVVRLARAMHTDFPDLLPQSDYEAGLENAYRTNLVQSLNRLSINLMEVGRSVEALRSIEQAFDLYGSTYESHSDAQPSDLAQSLNTLSFCLSRVDRQDQEPISIEEPVDLDRLLDESLPDAHLMGLALSLNSLSVTLNRAGRPEEALQSMEKAVTMHRMLYKAHPEAHCFELALSLNNLSLCLSRLGRQHDALRSLEEAVSIYRFLYESYPDAHRSDLATSLRDLSLCRIEVGQGEKALQNIEEAVELYAASYAAFPAAMAQEYAGALQNSADQHERVGNNGEAAQARAKAAKVENGN